MQTKIEQSQTLIRGVDKFFKDLSGQKLPDSLIFGSGIQQDFPRSFSKAVTYWFIFSSVTEADSADSINTLAMHLGGHFNKILIASLACNCWSFLI